MMTGDADSMCADAIGRGILLVNAHNGTALSVRRPGKQLGCRNVKGYTVFTLHLDGYRNQIKLHRAVWIAVNGRIPANLMPDHINGVKSDNRIANLRLVNAAGNAKNRRSYYGADNPSAKLTQQIALTIRTQHKELKSYRLVAQLNGVSRSLVAQIVRKELWT